MDDLSTKSDNEVKELIQRQNTLLSKKNFIANLKDGGSKIRNFKKRLEDELSRRQAYLGLSSITSNLALHLTATETLEWTGKCAVADEEFLDSDDDIFEETDPLKILLGQKGAGHHKKIYRTEKPVESLITDADVQEACESVGPENDVMYANQLCHRDENATRNSRIPFKPYSTVRSPSSTASSYKKPKGPLWEVTAATPPNYTHGEVKAISLSESLKLQKEHTVKLQEGKAKQAADRLAIQIERMHLTERRGSDASTSTGTAEEGEHEDEHGDEEDDDRGIVIYSLVD